MTRPDPHLLAAALAHTCRADWHLGGLRSYLAEHYPAEPLERLAVAAVLCALDPQADTIANLRNGGRRYWLDLDGGTAGLPVPPPVAEVLVDRMNAAPPDPERNRTLAAQARAELDQRLAGRVYHQPEGADT